MWWLFVIAAVVLLFAVFTFLVAPMSDKKRIASFFGQHKYFAHRGLWNKAEGVPENSLKAFERAADRGYGIELDLHVTKDDQLVVFHDDSLERMTGVAGKIEDYTLEELKILRLDGTDETIPTFREVLDITAGRSAFVVEMKGVTKNMRVNELAWEHLKDCGADFCIESFNPFMVQWWRKNHPEVVRGILSCKMRGKEQTGSALNSFLLENMMLNVLTRPDFVAYNVEDDNLFTFNYVRALGGYPVAWTVRTEELHERAKKKFKGIIFENIMK